MSSSLEWALHSLIEVCRSTLIQWCWRGQRAAPCDGLLSYLCAGDTFRPVLNSKGLELWHCDSSAKPHGFVLSEKAESEPNTSLRFQKILHFYSYKQFVDILHIVTLYLKCEYFLLNGISIFMFTHLNVAPNLILLFFFFCETPKDYIWRIFYVKWQFIVTMSVIK